MPSLNSLKRLILPGDRDGLLEGELRIAQSVAAVKQLPMVMFGNGVGALIGSLAIRGWTPWPFLLAGAMWALLIPVFVGYRRLRGLPSPVRVSRKRIINITIYSGVMGLLWAVSMIYYLPRVSFETLAFLITGCAFLAAGAAAAFYIIPTASAAYSAPIFVAGIYVTATYPHPSQFLLTLLLLLMACGVAWITYANWTSFLAMTKVTAERTRLLVDAKAAIVARNQFLENVSHEIRTPLTAVMGYTKLLKAQEAQMSQEHREALSYLDRSGVSLLTTIDALLDVAKLNAGQLALHTSAFDLRHLMNDALDAMSSAAQEKGIELFYACSPQVPKLLLGDAERTRQIVVNLLSNAVKFTDAGRIDVEITYELKVVSPTHMPDAVNGESTLCITVRDTGIGIEASKRGLIFHSFYQVDGSSRRRHGGIGLGLTVSHMLTQLMKGDLDFESGGTDATGSGTVFRCRLPLQPHLADAAVSALTKRADEEEDEDEEWHVLVVDDDPFIRHYLLTLLLGDGWRVHLAASGEAAIAASAAQRFDLILMDIQMPVMTGIEAANVIWESSSLNAATPIVAVTGYLSTDRIAELCDAGIVEYLSKPVVPEELLSKARQCVTVPLRASARGQASQSPGF